MTGDAGPKVSVSVPEGRSRTIGPVTILTTQTRLRLTVLAAVPLLLLAGCGGDDSADSADDAAPGDAAGDVPALQGEGCDSDVTLSGALEAQWSGEATVSTSEEVAPPATYQSDDGGYILTVSAAGNGFDDPMVTLLFEDAAYAVPFGEGTVDVRDDGSGATIDAAATNPADPDDTVQVQATFAC